MQPDECKRRRSADWRPSGRSGQVRL